MSKSNWIASGIAGALGLGALVFVAPRLTADCCPPPGATTALGIPTAAAASATPAAAAGAATLLLEGMSCESCAEGVRAALTKLDGVKTAAVDFSEKRATVAYDPAKITPQAMLDAVAKLGYTAKLADAKGS
jgi:Cu+-exporting ATPase